LEKPDLYLEDLFVSPAARRQGVGEFLIQGCADFALASGASRLYWQTQRKNESAQKLYNKVASLSEYIIFEKVFK
jgi:GNAT superfamily N-acetyltransferase